ncbi:class A beta-lactamase [Granulicella tundricola]|uniref:beta-lactamase n=1 Tax=Granulicella tundricola (strain ATCC BAA-1859 / DSM 23138 / MP5ACTX9) TaxID=1198114 RepID=E8X484_GRATM|nr:class A beta-lactamase [Granulicella tundricola]ADW67144.1 beta-lactamase [Granulicella tundricola MP5ACTX9]
MKRILACCVGLVVGSAMAQGGLRQQIRATAEQAKGKVSVACSLPGTLLDCDLHPDAHPPMQSVFKLPLGMAILDQVQRGRFTIDQPIRFLASDRIPNAYSPLQDEFPQADVDVPLRELLRLSVSLSDNCAADVLLRILGGPKVLQAYIDSLGIEGFHIQDDEAGLHQDVLAQYRNWFEPSAAVALLRLINDRPPFSRQNTALLTGWMKTPPDRPSRVAQALPKGIEVLHKTGTSDVSPAGVAYATNDIGLITLPDGRRLAVAVFVTDASADTATRDRVIAEISRQIYDAALQAKR